jgi:hypothetical protein
MLKSDVTMNPLKTGSIINIVKISLIMDDMLKTYLNVDILRRPKYT